MTFECPECNDGFGTEQGMKQHHYAAHDSPLPGLGEANLRRLYVDQRLSTYRMASETGHSEATICRRMEEYGIERRDNGVAMSISNRRKPASYQTHIDGYEVWKTLVGEGEKVVFVHRLLAVAEFGFEAVCDMEVHHKNNIQWDNRPGNLQPMTASEHRKHHAQDARPSRDGNGDFSSSSCRGSPADDSSL